MTQYPKKEFTDRKPETEILGADRQLVDALIQLIIDAGYSAHLVKKTIKVHSRKLSVELKVTKFTDWH